MNNRMKRINYSEIKNEQFIKVHKFLLGEEFREMSNDAKLLYGILRDRLGLSLKKIEEGETYWLDKNGDVFIHATKENIMDMLNCGNDKSIKVKKELVKFNLIDDIRKGQGNPNRIYLKNIDYTVQFEEKSVEDSINTIKTENQISENPKSRFLKIRNLDCNNTELNKTELNKTETTTTTGVLMEKMEYYTSNIHGTEKASKMDPSNSIPNEQLENIKIPTYSTTQINTLKEKFKQATGYETTEEYITDVAKECGIDNLEKTINRFNHFRPTGEVKNIHGIIRIATRREATGNAYTDNQSLKAKEQKTIKKPTQANNFSQREYDDTFFESLYDNF